ncbi:MAG: DUF3179 domain-containing protein, partial [Halobacteriales archaeon]|nr:DUF3179 domain-containing protein [Halobacteriales archaeon]
MPRLTRRRFLVTTGSAATFGLAGCTGGARNGGGEADGPDSRTDRPGSSRRRTTQPADGGGSADAQGPPIADRSLPVMYELERLQRNVQSGGPPKDGIPSIDDPVFFDADGGDEILDPGDIVFGYAGEEDVKAYPQSVLVWHEIVNDVLDGTPSSVTYCPLTGTVLGFRRGPTTFGVSGQLLNNNLIMYDRATDSRWPQVLGTAIAGRHQGQSLVETRLVWTTWEQWKSLHPETAVLSEQTGYARNYNRDPYGQYNPTGGYYAGGST